MLHIFPKTGLNLFWISTADRQGNWFVIARTARTATRFFEENENYMAGAAKTEIITSFPFSLRPEIRRSPCFAQIADLKEVSSIEIVDDGETSRMRRVRLNKRMFIEGKGIVPMVAADITLSDPTERLMFEVLP
jgi:hypothetical protein